MSRLRQNCSMSRPSPLCLFAGSSQLTGQTPVEIGRSVALAASDDALPEALDRSTRC